jgi:ketosteroid isomerase-like protein
VSQENLEIVQRAIAAVNARDLDGYLACCTEDVELRTPVAGGVYEGPQGIRRFLADIEDAAPDFRIDLHGLEAIGPDRVLAFIRTGSTGRASGILLAAESANVYDLVDGKISRIRIFLDRREALKAVGRGE